MRHPRRSNDPRSTRALLRCHRRGLPLTAYVAEGKTLLTSDMSEVRQADRARRLIRAKTAVSYLEQSVAHFDQSLTERRASPGGSRKSLVWLHMYERAMTEDRASLEAARRELVAAQRSASRPVGELVTPPLVSLPQPRTWPNAAPGGTSRRRCTIMKGRVALADHGYYDYPGGYAYGARLWGTFTAAEGRQPWVPVHVSPRVI